MKLSYKEFIRDENNIQKLVIFLHGYGSNGENLLALAPEISKFFPEVKFIAPNATYDCDIGLPDSYQWFTLSQNDPVKMSIEIVESNNILDQFIVQQLEKHNLNKDDLILIGFSQGAMMSMYNSLKNKDKIAGILALSGKLILPNEVKSNQNICLVHGTDDNVVPYASLPEAEEKLTELGNNIDSHSLNDLGHAIDYRVVKIIINYIKKLLNK
jgi:phospholipase/carboxylesterase